MNTKTRIANRYEIIEKIGSGGMGSVFLARDLREEGEVVVKVLNEALVGSGHNVSKFLDEGAKGLQLRHPNIVRVYDYGSSGDAHFIVMEYVKGTTVKELINRHRGENGPIPVRVVQRILVAVLSALEYALKHGIVAHRDVKSGNIMLDQSGSVKLLDFGNAKAMGFETYPTQWLTPEYESPEQGFPSKFDNKIDMRSDIYSLGIVMYEMLTGHLPFTGSAGEVSEKHLKEDLPISPNARIPAGLVSILRKATAKSPAGRYQTPREMLEDVQRGYARNPAKTVNESPTKPREPWNKMHPDNGTPSPVVSRPVRPDGVRPLSLAIAGGVVGIVLLVLILSGLASRLAPGPVDNGVPIKDATFIYPASDSTVYYTVDDYNTMVSSVYAKEGDGESMLVATADSFVSQIAVSGDGRYLAFAGGTDENGFPQPILHIMDLDSRKTAAESSPDEGSVVDLAFAQDGSVLFTLEKGESSDILQLDIARRERTTLISNGARNTDPVLIDSILYFIDKSDSGTVRRMNVQTQDVETLAITSVSLIQVMGQQLFYVDDKGNIHRVELVGSGVSGDAIVRANTNSYTIVRLFVTKTGCKALITKSGTYELTGELR